MVNLTYSSHLNFDSHHDKIDIPKITGILTYVNFVINIKVSYA